MATILTPSSAPAGMTYLDLVNRARRECGVSGADLTTLQNNLTKEGQRFKDWVNDAWREVQMAKPDWEWMRLQFQFDTVVSQNTYSFSQTDTLDLADWRLDAFRCYTTATGTVDEQILPFMYYNTWRDVYQYASMRDTSGRPTVITIQPDHTLAIGPLPDQVYTITGEFYRVPTDLTADADDPSSPTNGLPARFHMLLVYKAMAAYALFESAAEVAARAMKGEKHQMNRLLVWGMPMITMGAPLA